MRQELLSLQAEWQRMNRHKRDALNQINAPIKRGIVKVNRHNISDRWSKSTA
ncbi:hypothetical protein [Escherichia coli]|uniref:hypothetical protein n=1 Tax=Escherichia coli TaxID=562 RepID=UPI0015F12DD3|nr:hypothetical protein [Escherichia coli]